MCIACSAVAVLFTFQETQAILSARGKSLSNELCRLQSYFLPLPVLQFMPDCLCTPRRND